MGEVPEALEVRRARFSAITVSAMAVGFGLVGMLQWQSLPHWPVRALQIGAIAIALGVMGWVLTHRYASPRAYAVAYLVSVLPVPVYVWLVNDLRAAQGVYWVAFEPNKLGSLLLALLAPTVAWAPALAIGAFTGSALVQYFLMPASAHQWMAAGEPWTILEYGGLAAGLAVHRLRLHRVEATALRALTEARSAQRTAQLAVALSDLANTPIQTLVVTSQLIRVGAVAAEAAANRIDRALARLQQLSQLLARHGRAVEWTPELESFDARDYVERALSDKPLS